MIDNSPKNGHKLKRAFSSVVMTLLLVVFDMFTKALAVSKLKGEEPFVLLSGILEFTYVENRGAAFGFLSDMGNGPVIFFSIAATMISVLIFVLLMKLPGAKRYIPLSIDLVFVMAGAVGNLIDRLTRSYVVDFIYFKFIDFPVFNVADIYITCSVFVLFLLLIFYYKDDELEHIWS